ncbi:hypothetical protein D7231_32090 [Streptomyces klenkii]|uniref:Uncharacterized protein n=1 Tax=Streptomyces klenkii TaxID=1420899 RepID=A0A3B0AN09_9ACTN|nr:hypothetical protein [Streptomyces klenkii]RKN61913.1 hypothetical protein D7231_32090 [Streptomyces klenkii]
MSPNTTGPRAVTDESIEAVIARQRNARAVELLLNEHPTLPARTIVTTPDVVHVIVADPDDLEPWIAVRGGEVHVSPEWEDVQTWTLHTTTEPATDGSVTLVRVSTVVVARVEGVLPEVRAAVSR